MAAVRDLSGIVTDIGGDAPLDDGLRRLSGLSAQDLPQVPGLLRLGPPVAQIGKIIGVGLNYRDHALETKLPLTKEPTLFLKATSALTGPADDLLIPRDPEFGHARIHCSNLARYGST
jgi:2-keto-4-pentenoate hydratase/2-oxohepta-3-ene-1,7-dioic acid hydratase in catechol pathway